MKKFLCGMVSGAYDIKVFDLNSEFGTEFDSQYFLDDKLHLSIEGQHLIGEKIDIFVNENLN